ncbi:hypothetical protein FPZ42_07085 [Mucilaginibacter achroorhodeus]|uniref:Uncharacterized protein n=1 Tax=Mucilaginibacter achroorhodeus TaxID=2599294 RepID=A0A563U638_9SPHI|nr:hypothetical protein [Mucilaginibacter achroorhodeus]TWR26795.1 hypothetical protein FPZ42_07085 [Mucilaginibacter achroorhodeus]
MQSITAYVLAGVTTLILLLLCAIIANAINYEKGSRPKDPVRRRTWFWVLAILNPGLIFLLGYYAFKPEANIMVVKRYVTALSIGTACGFVIYLLIGFILSRIFRNGKIGHWF